MLCFFQGPTRSSQEGLSSFRFVLMPHENFNPSVAEKEAIAQRQPLITHMGGSWLSEKSSLINLENTGLVITSVKPINHGKQLFISIYNAGNNEEIPAWKTPFKEIVITDPDGLKEEAISGNNAILPQGILYLKVTK